MYGSQSRASRSSRGEREPLCSGGDYVATATKDARAGFVRKVYGILGVQLLVTTLVAAPIQQASKAWVMNNMHLLYLSTGVLMATLCAMMCCSGVLRTYPYNYISLAVFTLVQSVVVGFASVQYTWQSVLLCAGLTGGVFIGLTIYATVTDTDFTGMGMYLFGAMLALILWGFMIMILQYMGVAVKWAMMAYDLFGVMLFVLYIVYDTQLILGGDHAKFKFSIDDYCFAALSLYMDIVNLFLHLLRLFGERK